MTFRPYLRLPLSGLLLSLLIPSIAAETYVVRPNGSGDFPDIQAALDAAEDGDVIELTDGSFVGSGNRNLLFHGKALVVRSQSGDPQACVIDCEESGRGFHFCFGEQSSSIIRDITIVNGLPLPTSPYGGAIFCEAGSSPWIVNCVFRNNVSGWGGAICCLTGSSPTVIHCTFDANDGGLGGALACEDSAPILLGCSLTNNLAQRGGAVYAYLASPSFSNCDFVGNGLLWYCTPPDRGGGAICITGAWAHVPISIAGCTFVENIISCSGGAVYCGGSNVVSITDCLFDGNRSEQADGGGLMCAGSTLQV